MSTSIIFLAIPVAPASLLHTLVHLEHLCSSSGFHMLLRSNLHAAAIVPELESPQSAWNRSSKQALDGIIKTFSQTQGGLQGLIYSSVYMRGWAVVPAFPDLIAFGMMCVCVVIGR